MECRYVRDTELLYKEWDKTEILFSFLVRITKARSKPTSTVKLYRHVICKFWKETGITDPDLWLDECKTGKRNPEGEFLAYMESLIAKTELGSSILNLTRTAILKFCKVMKLPIPELPEVGNGDTKRNPTPFTKDDIKALLDVSISPRDRALILLASCSGLRSVEICGLAS